MNTTRWLAVSVSTLLLAMVAGTARAQSRPSDTLTVSDTLGFLMSGSLSELQEPGLITITYPGFTETVNDGTMFSDSIVVTPFNVTLTSDGPDVGPNFAELAFNQITIRATSDTASGFSDTLTVADSFGFKGTMTLTESQEAGGVTAITVAYPGLTVTLPEPLSTVSDTLTITPFTVTLTSDNLTEPTPNPGENGFAAIKVLATSDVPEPGLVSFLVAGTISTGFVVRRRRQKAR